MNAPRYAVYMMVDEPHGNKSTYGYSTAGWVAAPAAGRVIARIAPMLGMLPDLQDAPAINQALSIPLEPGRPAGAFARGPGTAGASEKPGLPARPAATGPVAPAVHPTGRDPRHEAAAPPGQLAAR
jgi:cell division protein FtsI (penicillin-binding protein 3)